MMNSDHILSKESGREHSGRTRSRLKGLAAWVLVLVMIFTTAVPAFAQTSDPVCGMEEHTHTADCYDENGELICTIPEHTHTADCYEADAQEADDQAVYAETEEEEQPSDTAVPAGDPTADTETAAQWEETFADVVLTGDWGADTAAIAKTQLGYAESTENFTERVDDSGNVVYDGYTRYAAWYTDDTDDYADWSAMFCSFCYSYAGVPLEQMPEDAGAADWIGILALSDQYHTVDSDYAPKTGDLIFFDTDLDGLCDRVGLVTDVADGRIHTIEGDVDGVVAEADYTLEDEIIVGFGELPENPDYIAAPSEEAAAADLEGEAAPVLCTDETDTAVTDGTLFITAEDDASEELADDTVTQTAEDDGFRVTVDYSETAGLPDDAVLNVTSIDPSSQLFAEYAKEYEAATGMPMDFLLDVSFSADGEEIEPEAPVQVTLSFTDDQAEESTDPEILHFAEEGTEEIDSTPIDENSETSFTMDSFSLIAGTLYNGVSYDLSDDGVLTISGNGALYYSSSSSVPWYSQRENVKKIVVKEGITGLGGYAFYGCSNVTEVQLPSSLTSIGKYDFYNCSSLTSITLPDGLTEIGMDAFCNCTSLTSVTLPDGLTTLGREAFGSCTSLTSIKIPAGVTVIDNYAFYKCSALADVTLHEGLTEIGSGAFEYCSALADITLPETVTYIGGAAFVGCTSMSELTIPASVTGFGEGIVYSRWSGTVNGNTIVNITDLKALCGIDFRGYEYNPMYNNKGCPLYLNSEKITDLVIPAGTPRIGSYMFYCNTALTSLTIEEGTTSIGTSTFGYCKNIQTVTLPSTLTSIEADAFKECTGIKTVYFDGTATQWASIAKSNTYSNPAYNGASVYVKNADGEYVPYSALDVDMTGWTSIPDYCFYNAKNLTSLEIPDTVVSIGKYAFSGCTGLTSITVPESVTTIGNGVFSGCTSLKSAVLPSTLTSIPEELFCNCNKLQNIDIPAGVTSIGEEAFYYCSALTSVDIPDGVTSIGSNAFYRSGLTSVDLPDGLTTLGYYPFEYMTGDTLVIPDSVTKAGSQGTFKNFTVGAGLTAIPDYSLGKACETLTVRCRTLNSAGYSYTYSNTPVLTVIFDDTVDSVSQTAADGLKKYSYTNVLFNGPNQLVLPNITTSTKSIAAGTYYADANGVLYLLDTENKTASLILVPDGLETYTIPASFTADEGITYTVTGVESNAFSASDDLVTLTIAAPGNLTEVGNMAFAGAENLESINGITDGTKVAGLFTAEGAEIGSLLVLGTKLTEESTGKRTTDPVTTEYKMNEDDVVKVIVSAASGNAVPLNADTGDTYSEYYTGVGYAGDITISNSANMGDTARATTIHVYIAFDAYEGTLTPDVGSRTVTVDGVAVPYEVKKVQDGLYCIDIKVDDTYHKTVEVPFSVTYPNGTAGGAARIWTEINDRDAADFTQAGTASYQQVEWITQPNTFHITKSTGTTPQFVVSGDTAYVGAISYNLYPRTDTTRKGSYGSDIVTDITLTDVLTLDEDMKWADGVLDAVRKGSVYIQNPNAGVSGGWYVERNVYACLDDGTQVKLAYLYYYQSSYSGYITLNSVKASVVQDENGRDTVAITVNYSNTKATDRITEMSNLSLNLVTGDRAIVLDRELSSALLGETFTLKNTVSETRSYLYSEDRTTEAEVTKELQLSRANFSFTKEASSTSYSYYGSSYPTYYLKLSNTGNLPYTTMQDVYDTLDVRYYLTAASMYKMLTDASWGEYLTIDITGACFENAAFEPEYVTLVTGETSTYQTNTQDSGYGTSYGDSGAEGWGTAGDNLFISENTANYTTGTLKLYWQDGKCYIQKNDETPIELTTADDLDTALDEMGYFVSADTQFKTTWNLPKDCDTGFTVPGNTTYTFSIYPTMKDTFMMITQDHETEYSSASRQQYVNNTGYADGTNGSHFSKTTSQITYKQDFTIKKAAMLNGAETDTAGVGDVLTYSVSVTNAGSHYYQVLPWTDCMTGSQILLAPVSTNTALADSGLTVYTDSAGTQYYELTPGTYSDVWIGGKCADTVEVTGSSGSYRTLIRWYFQGTMSSTTTMTYQALVMAGTMDEDYDERTGFSLGNVTWLGDHQGHRIFAPVTVSGHNMYHDKSIVTGKTDSGEDILEKYSVVEEGNTVTYRLDIENRGGDAYTVTPDALSDQLPLSLKASDDSWSWLWTNKNVKVAYSSSNGDDGFTITKPDSWYLTDGERSGSGTGWQQYLCWDTGFRVVIEPNTTFYIYVELTYPENSGTDDYWTRYCEMNAGNDIQNIFHFLDMTDVVTHELGDAPVAQLQKGVIATSRSSSGGDKDTSLFYYENGAATVGASSNWYTSCQYNPQRWVKYYTVIYNDGNSRLYLDELQDVLPEGFIPYISGIGILSSGYVTLPDGATLLTSTSGTNANSVTASGKWDSTNGRAVITINLTLDKDHYNSENGHYYLLPGEAIGFAYYAYTASSAYTEDIAVNTVAMSYYNYYNLPIEVTTAEITGSGTGENTWSNPAGTFTPNDGGCDVYTSEDVKAMGMDASRTTNTQWLVSSVQLTRTRLVPGIQKTAYSSVTSGGSTTMDPTVIHNGDKVTWKVTLMNDGDGLIRGYTLVDTISMSAEDGASSSAMPANRFIGDIYCSNVSSSYPVFTITGWSDDGQTASVKLLNESGNSHYYNSGTLKLNSGSAAIAQISYGSYYLEGNRSYSYRYGYMYMYLSTDEDNNMVLKIYSPSEYITAGSQVVYTITTEQPSSVTRFGEITNTASLAIGDSYDPMDVTHDDHSDDSDTTVTWSDSVWLLSSHMTYPEIQVTETADTTNYGIGSSSDNHIVLPQRDSEFYYTLTVSNSTNYNMQKLVMINNLPEVGDSDTYNAESKRDSAFKVVLDPNKTDFTVKVTDQDGKVTVLDPKYYTIEFSTQTNFDASADDWNGNISDSDSWIAQSDWTGDLDSVRSVRVVITDPAESDDELSIIPKNSKITVDFNALVDDPFAVDEDGNYIAPDATIAWETFGYRYWMPGVDYLFAGSRKVGVEIPSTPYLAKKLQTDTGSEYRAKEDQTFRILIYTGSAVESSYWNTDDLAASLSGREFTVVDVTVPKGSSASDVIRLENLQAWTVDGDGQLTPTDTDWVWVTDGTYTAVELLNEDQRQTYSTGWEGTTYTTLTFANSGVTATCVNTVSEMELPMTGGSGFQYYTSLGLLALAAAATIGAVILRKREKKA